MTPPQRPDKLAASLAAEFMTRKEMFDAPLIDYSGVSTITGWASYTTKQIKYRQVGNMYFFSYNLLGTSNSATTSFTLPITLTANFVSHRVLVRGVNSGTSVVAYARVPGATLPSAVIDFLLLDGTSFANSGMKGVEGEFVVTSV